MSEHDSYRPSTEEPRTETSEAAEKSEGLVNSELGGQAKKWFDARVEELKTKWEAGEKFDEGVREQLVEIFKAGAGLGIVETASIDTEKTEGQTTTEGRRGKWVLAEDPIDNKSFWDILMSGERAGDIVDEFLSKIDRLGDKFDIWFNNKFLPPPDGLDREIEGWSKVGVFDSRQELPRKVGGKPVEQMPETQQAG